MPGVAGSGFAARLARASVRGAAGRAMALRGAAGAAGRAGSLGAALSRTPITVLAPVGRGDSHGGQPLSTGREA